MSIQTVTTRQLNERNGKPRLWIEGKRLTTAGFAPGAMFVVEHHQQGIMLKLAELGTNKVSRRERQQGRVDSIIDIGDMSALKPLEGCKTLRVVWGEGHLYITPLASEMRRVRRLKRLKARLQSGENLKTAGVASGGGVLDHAVHTGMGRAGVNVRLHAFNEIREDLTEQALEHNEFVTDETVVLNMPLQELAFDDSVLSRLGEVDVISMGLPCSGASTSGRAKLKTPMPEAHPDVGHLVAGAVAIIAKLNPACCIFENVKPWANSASAFIMRQQLRDLGYELHERDLYGPDFGDIEARTRWSMVAVSRGIPFNYDDMPVPQVQPRKLADVLDSPEAVADRWSPMEGLKAKQVRDIKEGKNFLMRVYTGEEEIIGCLTKGIAKNRSTDPKIQHPSNSELLRVPTAAEHARCKGVPEHLIDGLSQTKAHELLGQSVNYSAFSHLGEYVANALKNWASSISGCATSAIQQIRGAAAAGQADLFKAAA